MLTKRIIPCLDVAGGRVVKGVRFVNIIDAGDPVEAARRYAEEGADELAFLDITASHEKRRTMFKVVEQVAKEVFIPMTVGGGVRTFQDVRDLLNAGADKASVNTSAVENPELIQELASKIGSQCITVAIDARARQQNGSPAGAGGWEVFSHGGRKATGMDAVAWAKRMADYGAGEILLTSMDRDGTKAGFDLELTRTISTSVNVPIIASGGVGTLEHLASGVIDGQADAILAASIFHFRTHSIQEAKQYLASRGLMVRI